MARRRGSNVGDMQLSFDLWGLEDSAPDDVVSRVTVSGRPVSEGLTG